MNNNYKLNKTKL